MTKTYYKHRQSSSWLNKCNFIDKDTLMEVKENFKYSMQTCKVYKCAWVRSWFLLYVLRVQGGENLRGAHYQILFAQMSSRQLIDTWPVRALWELCERKMKIKLVLVGKTYRQTLWHDGAKNLITHSKVNNKQKKIHYKLKSVRFDHDCKNESIKCIPDGMMLILVN